VLPADARNCQRRTTCTGLGEMVKLGVRSQLEAAALLTKKQFSIRNTKMLAIPSQQRGDHL
jgi:hypothetical protein